jgi:tmRNA-binding protein
MSTPANQTTPATSAPTPAAAEVQHPPSATLIQAAKIAIENDRAIMLDYYIPTIKGTACLGEDAETKERMLVKSKEEFTSLIKKIFKVGDDFLIMTENSLYIVSGKIQKRKINIASLQEAYDSL